MRHVQDAVLAGRIADADPLVVAHAILGVTNQLARTFILNRGDAWQEVADAAIAFCLGGLFGESGGQATTVLAGPVLTGA